MGPELEQVPWVTLIRSHIMDGEGGMGCLDLVWWCSVCDRAAVLFWLSGIHLF